MQYKFFTNSEDAWVAMQQVISNAQKFIYWEVYIFNNDLPTHRFANILKEKARVGVSVKIIIDSIGSLDFSNTLAQELRASGVELIYFNELPSFWNPRRLWRWIFLRTHRKLLIVDGEVGFIGSVNVGRKYQQWQELHIQVKGLILRHFIKSFAKMYRYCGGKDTIIIPPKNQRRVHSWLLEHAPWRKNRIIKNYYIEKCSNAKNNITIVTPYFVPHHWLLKILREAVVRGVGVDVIIPKTTDIWFSDIGNRVFAMIAMQSKINFLLFPKMIHAKVLLVDNAYALVGSQNINPRSFDHDIESSLAFKDSEMIKDLGTIINDWKLVCAPLNYPKNKRRWYHPLLEKFFEFIRPIL